MRGSASQKTGTVFWRSWPCCASTIGILPRSISQGGQKAIACSRSASRPWRHTPCACRTSRRGSPSICRPSSTHSGCEAYGLCRGGWELCRGGRGHVRARVEYNWRTGTRHITTTTHHHHVRIFHIKPHPTGDSLAAPAMSESCCYCQAPLHQGVANVAALACGHVFHETCLQQHQRHSGIRNLGDLRCPECRMDAHACSQREAAIMRGDTPARAEPARKKPRAMQWPSSQDRERVHTRPSPTMLTSHAASSSSRQTRAATPQRLAQVQASTLERRASVPPLSGSPSIQPRALVLAAATPRRRRPHTELASQDSPLATLGGHSPPSVERGVPFTLLGCRLFSLRSSKFY